MKPGGSSHARRLSIDLLAPRNRGRWLVVLRDRETYVTVGMRAQSAVCALPPRLKRSGPALALICSVNRHAKASTSRTCSRSGNKACRSMKNRGRGRHPTTKVACSSEACSVPIFAGEDSGGRRANTARRSQRQGAIERPDRDGSFRYWPPVKIPRVVRDHWCRGDAMTHSTLVQFYPGSHLISKINSLYG